MVVTLVCQTRNQTEIYRIELPTPFRVGTVNSFLIVSGEHKVLVDTGIKYAPAKEALENGLEEHGVGVHEIDGVVLTHGHVDHIGWTSLFRNLGAIVYSHPDVSTWLSTDHKWDEYRIDFFRHLYKICGLDEESTETGLADFFDYRELNDQSVVDVALAHGKPFPLLPEFEVLYVPGHAQAAIALFHRETGELIIGDQLLPHISSNALIEPTLDAARGELARRTQSLVDYRRNLKELLNYQITKVYPGHGEVFSEAAQLIESRLADQGKRLEKFISFLKSDGPQTVFQLATRYFPRHRDQISLIVSETLGYLDWGQTIHRVQCEVDEDGVMLWSAT